MTLVLRLAKSFIAVLYFFRGACSKSTGPKDSRCSIGEWMNSNGSYIDRNKIYSTVVYNSTARRHHAFMLAACPAEIFNHNCMWHGIVDRTNAIHQRVWRAKDPSCKEFNQKDFLQLAKGRKIVFAGDSIMSQIWLTLTCTFRASAGTDLQISWQDHRSNFVGYDRSPYNEHTCPLKAKMHCFYNQASLRFKFLNTVFILDGGRYKYEKGLLSKIIQKHRLSKKDIAIFNFGTHYNLASSIKSALINFWVDYRDLKDQTMLPPHVLFMETTPQHFRQSQGNASGYYSPQSSRMHCEPLRDLAQAHADDWRNRNLDELLPEDVMIVRIADAMRSQWDAHIGFDSPLFIEKYGWKRRPTADCSHWCQQSAVFPYIHRVLYNVLLAKLRSNFS